MVSRCFYLFSKHLKKGNLRLLSSNKTIVDEKIVLTDDGLTVVCWHPDKPFPYECSKAIPVDTIPSNSILKIQNHSAVKNVFKPKPLHVVQEELRKMTHSTKHIWFPRARDKKAKKTPMNRPYL